MPTVGVGGFEADHPARHMICHTMEMMLAAMSVIWGGMVDRHPRLRIGFLESGGGWIAPWLDRMDRHFDDQGFNETAPSVIAGSRSSRSRTASRCWRTIIGPHKIMWATDYPHQDRFFPGAPQMVRDRIEPLSAARHQVLAEGAMGFYALN